MEIDEVVAALPEGMHRFAYLFLHPPSNGEGSPAITFEPDQMNSLAEHLERHGYERVREPKDRYQRPPTGPIHPHNPGRWVSKSRPVPKTAAATPSPIDDVIATLAGLSPHDRAEVLAATTGVAVIAEDTEGTPDEQA